MARLPRLAVAGWPHHLVQRVPAGQALVIDDTDRQAWQRALREAAVGAGVAVHAYVLLDDRFQLVATPERSASLSLMMQGLGRRYVADFNRRHGRQGSLWAGRFRATVIEPDRHLLPAMVHIERLPLDEGLVRDPADHAWSSSAHHLGRRRDPLIVEPAPYWALGNTPFDREMAWRRLLEDGGSAGDRERLEQFTHRGWALGSEAFVQRLGADAARPLLPRKRGRPKRAAPSF
jgi:putative transposase